MPQRVNTWGLRSRLGAIVAGVAAVIAGQVLLSAPVAAVTPQAPFCGPTIAASWEESDAIRANGTLYGWGEPDENEFGLGPSSTSTRNKQPIVQGLSGTVVGVWATRDDDNTLALKADGTIWGAGNNDNGTLGHGDSVSHDGYVQASTATGLTTALALAAGDSPHGLALAPDNTVWGFGYNGSGAVGDGTNTERDSPAHVVGPTGTGTLGNVVAISAGYVSVALKADGTVWTWGEGGSGELGNGSNSTSNKPVQVKGAGGTGFLTNIKAISAGTDTVLALKTDGTVWAWGLNSNGELGDNSATNANSNLPVQVVGVGGTGFLTGVIAVSAGYEFSTALLSDGSVRAWGSNSKGQLGNGLTGSPNDSKTPVQVKGIGGTGTLSGISQVSAGREHVLGLRPDGSVVAWGANYDGQIGNNTGGVSGATQPTPVQVSQSTGLTAVPGACLAVGAVSPASTNNTQCTGGQQMTITGSGFLGATAVKFGTTPATSFSVTSDRQITAVVPAGVGTKDVTVTTPRGTTAATAADRYTCTLAAVASPSPTPVPTPALPKAGQGPTAGANVPAAALLVIAILLAAPLAERLARRWKPGLSR